MLRKLSLNNRLKGQYTLFAMFMTVITIIAYAYIYPVLKSVLDATIPTMDSATGTIVALSPLFIFFFILYGSLWYVVPHREER